MHLHQVFQGMSYEFSLLSCFRLTKVLNLKLRWLMRRWHATMTWFGHVKHTPGVGGMGGRRNIQFSTRTPIYAATSIKRWLIDRLTCGHRPHFCRQRRADFFPHLRAQRQSLWRISWPGPCHRSCKKNTQLVIKNTFNLA